MSPLFILLSVFIMACGKSNDTTPPDTSNSNSSSPLIQGQENKIIASLNNLGQGISFGNTRKSCKILLVQEDISQCETSLARNIKKGEGLTVSSTDWMKEASLDNSIFLSEELYVAVLPKEAEDNARVAFVWNARESSWSVIDSDYWKKIVPEKLLKETFDRIESNSSKEAIEEVYGSDFESYFIK